MEPRDPRLPAWRQRLRNTGGRLHRVRKSEEERKQRSSDPSRVLAGNRGHTQVQV